jgi:hypothetical protein
MIRESAMPDEYTPADKAATEAERESESGGGAHEAPDGAPLHPLIDLSRDPNPGRADHAKPED